MSYTYVLSSTNPSGGSTPFTVSGLNLGSGAIFTVLGIAINGNQGITGIAINGTTLNNSSGTSAGSACSIWSGLPTLTGSDSVAFTGSAITFVDFTLFAWTLTGLSSTTPITSGLSSGASALVTSGGTVLPGDYVFAVTTYNFGGGGATLDFGSSLQAPDSPPTNPNRVVGAFNTPSCSANWTAASGGIVSGSFHTVITESGATYTNVDGAMAVWRPTGALILNQQQLVMM